MDLRRDGTERLIFRHDGERTTRMFVAVIGGIIVFALFIWFLSGTTSPLPILATLGLALGFFWLVRRTQTESIAIFDLENGAFGLRHSRRGQVVEEIEVPLTAIEAVIVDVAAGGNPRTLALRPAVVIEKTIVPLTQTDFESGERPKTIATALRLFLGHDDYGLIDDSIAALARFSPRIQPAIRLARLGKGLSRTEAFRLVSSLREVEPTA
ncbi:MAG: hypothetical protein KDJ16_02035 [Hyphomicrobiales bacterium]|nr:hypothetical protein [Hyphomicrobiales bacterium]